MPHPTLNIELVKLLSEASPFAATLMNAPGFGPAVRAVETYLNTPSDSHKRARPDRIHMSEIQDLVAAAELSEDPFSQKDIEYVFNVIQNTGLGLVKCADYTALDLEHSNEETIQLMQDLAGGNPHAAERAKTLVVFYKLDPKAKLHPTPSDEALAANPMAATAPRSPSQVRVDLPVVPGGFGANESVEAAIARAARPRKFSMFGRRK